MIVAIIDDGVNVNTGDNLEFSLQIDENGMIQKYTEPTDNLSHGSICAAILQKYSPDVKLGSIKILDAETKRGDCNHLIKAIHWCIHNNVKIINLSLGSTSTNDYQSLLQVVNAAYQKDIIIVSACKNGSAASYPAVFSNVIGVQCDSALQGDVYYAREPNYNGIDFSASACHELKELHTSPYNGLTPVCNSYAAPVITAKVYSVLTKLPHITLDRVKLELNLMSKIYTPSYRPTRYKYTDWVDHAALLVIGDSPINTSNMHNWNVQSIIHLDSYSTSPVLNKTTISQNTTLAVYNSASADIKLLNLPKEHPLLFLNRISCEELADYPHRVFVPTLIDDYDTKQTEDNERPIVAIIEDTASSEYPLYRILKDMFIQKGFHTLLLSEHAIDVLVGAVYIDNADFYKRNCICMAEQLRYELFITHTTVGSLEAIQPDVVLCDANSSKTIHEKITMNTPVIEMNNRSSTELFLEICDLICE